MVKREKIYILGILLVAAVFRFYPIDRSGDIWSITIGFLTVPAMYFLAAYVFNRKIALLSAFFLAVSSWHISLSKFEYQPTLSVFLSVLCFYFLWRGIKTGALREFLIAGLIAGLGVYSDLSFLSVIIVGIIIFINYLFILKSDFFGPEYIKSKSKLVRGFVLAGLAVLIVNLPVILDGYISYNHAWFRINPDRILDSAGLSTVMLVFLAAGFIKEFLHWMKRKHGHFSSIHTFLIAWLLIPIAPEFLSGRHPDILKAAGATPAIMVFAALGLKWLLTLIFRLHRVYDPHYQFDMKTYRQESQILMKIMVIVLLAAISIVEFYKIPGN